MLALPHYISNFCIQLLELLDDPELNTLLVHFYAGSIDAELPVNVKIHTNHLNYYDQRDFQFQMLINQSEIQVWCCCVDLNSLHTKYFSYQYHTSNGETVLGNMQDVNDWIQLNFKTGYFREMLCRHSQGL